MSGARAFAVGDRVRMRTGLTSTVGEPAKLLRGVVEAWDEGGPGGLLVVWDDWPCVTSLPNPNVELDEDTDP